MTEECNQCKGLRSKIVRLETKIRRLNQSLELVNGGINSSPDAKILKLICGGLNGAISHHGPIGKDLVHSAAKRVLGELRDKLSTGKNEEGN